MTIPPTPAAQWRVDGKPDPHGERYDTERAELMLGQFSDDELANGAYMNYDQRLSVDDLVNPKEGQYPPLIWMTAVKDRIRWLSRSLEKALGRLEQVPARQFNGSMQSAKEIMAWVNSCPNVPGTPQMAYLSEDQGQVSFWVRRPERPGDFQTMREYRVVAGDWVVRTQDGFQTLTLLP